MMHMSSMAIVSIKTSPRDRDCLLSILHRQHSPQRPQGRTCANWHVSMNALLADFFTVSTTRQFLLWILPLLCRHGQPFLLLMKK